MPRASPSGAGSLRCSFTMTSSSALFRNKSRLAAALQDLPRSSGVYRFYDVTDAIIYVGKSVCLRDRVRSYFTGRATTKKLRRLRQEIARLDWQVTGSELEALLLESRLVKRHHPRFNVMLRSFVPLPYVRVDREDPFPRLEVTRSPGTDGATYFGPFRNHGAVEAAVQTLTDVLGLRNCDIPAGQLHRQRPCYRAELGTCSAPCTGEVPQPDYREAVRAACEAFGGGSQSPLRMLETRMERAAENLRFETAARIRDSIRQIQSVTGRQHALRSAVGNLSLVAACPSSVEASVCMFVFEQGRLIHQEDVPAGQLGEAAGRRALAERLAEARTAQEIPPAVRPDGTLAPEILDEVQIVTTWMKQKTRQGEYWEFPSAGADCVPDLDAWLQSQVPSAA
jgi:excinuclease UvrABC nuclease subunit